MNHGAEVFETLANVSKNLMGAYDSMIKLANTIDEPEKTEIKNAAESVFQAVQSGRHNLGQAMIYVQNCSHLELVAEHEVGQEKEIPA